MNIANEYWPVLLHTPLFCGIAESDLTALLACLGPRVQHFDAGSSIFAEGSPAGQIGLVLAGRAQVVQDDFYGNRHIVAALEAGEVFAEAFACAGVPSLPVSVLAVQSCTVLLLDIDRILHPCQNACGFHQKIVLNLLQNMARKNLQMNQKLSLLSHKTTRQKLMAYLSAQAKAAGSCDFTITFDRQQLADYLGVERSAMSAELSKLRREGFLTAQKSHFCLLCEWAE